MLISGYLHPIPDMSPVIPSLEATSALDPSVNSYDARILFFYKTWDPYGAFSNFSPHPLRMPDGNGDYATWPTVEHYYQVESPVCLSFFFGRTVLPTCRLDDPDCPGIELFSLFCIESLSIINLTLQIV